MVRGWRAEVIYGTIAGWTLLILILAIVDFVDVAVWFSFAYILFLALVIRVSPVPGKFQQRLNRLSVVLGVIWLVSLYFVVSRHVIPIF